MSVAAVRKEQDIEQLVVWALRDQGLGWVGKERQKLTFEDYGTSIDDGVGSHPTIGLWSDDDAMLVKVAIDGLPLEARMLIVQYGRTAMRPDWVEEGYGSIQQLRDGRGRLRWVWEDPVNRTGAKRPLMGFVGEHRENVDFHRAQYHVWWQGLADIVLPLNGRMERHVATGPAVAHSPWIDSGKPTIFAPNGSVLPPAEAKAKVSDMPLEVRRANANDPVLARATDWSVPSSAPRRHAAR